MPVRFIMRRMPRWTLYNCLNPACGHSFDALSNQPECPKCRSIKLQERDYGNMPPTSMRADPTAHTSTSVLRRTDATLRNLATDYGLTDINNKNGQAAKGHHPRPEAGARGKYGNMNVLGVDVPINDTITTVSGSTPYTAFKAPVAPQGGLPGRETANKALSGMTKVTAEHKGAA